MRCLIVKKHLSLWGCRFTSPDQGSLAVVVAPVLRFLDVGFNADVHIEELGPPEKLISGFAPELFGSPLTVRLMHASPGSTVQGSAAQETAAFDMQLCLDAGR